MGKQIRFTEVHLVIQGGTASELHRWCFFLQDQCSFYPLQAVSGDETETVSRSQRLQKFEYEIKQKNKTMVGRVVRGEFYNTTSSVNLQEEEPSR